MIIISCCCSSINAQTTRRDSCNELREMFGMALYRLDSLTGYNITLTKQIDSIRTDVVKQRAKISNILKEQNETIAALKDAKKLILDLSNHIKEQGAELKRLSGNKPPTKKTN